jgi:glycosyltransferase involved in cell wall biosynthesis
MNKQSTVSCVVITYNQEKFIAETIDSILAQQTEYDYDIVIGDDCSTDGTSDIINEYITKYPTLIKVIKPERNMGLLDNFYRTIKAANGKYIACCAGDDYWHNTEKLQKQIHYLESNSDCGMVHAGADIINEEGRLINRILKRSVNSTYGLGDTLSKLIAADYPVIAPTAAFRKDLFDKYYDIDELKENNIPMEDTPLWIRIAANARIYYFEESFASHRDFEGTISNPKSIQGKIDFLYASERCLNYFFTKYEMRLNNPSVVHDAMKINVCKAILKVSLENGDKNLFLNTYKQIAGITSLTIKDKVKYYASMLPFGLDIMRYVELYRSRLSVYR